MAQSGHETDRFNTFIEYTNADGTNAWCGNYEGGCTYRGRGAIQLTHRGNYQRAGNELGQDFVRNPDLVRQTRFAFEVAGLFWKWNSRDLNSCADNGDVYKCTRVINGGQNGIDDRLALYRKAQQCIPAGGSRATVSDQNSFSVNSMESSSASSSESSWPVIVVIVVGSIVLAGLASLIVIFARKLQSVQEQP